MFRFVLCLAVLLTLVLLILFAPPARASGFRGRTFNRGFVQRRAVVQQRGFVTHRGQFNRGQVHRGFGQVHHR